MQLIPILYKFEGLRQDGSIHRKLDTIRVSNTLSLYQRSFMLMQEYKDFCKENNLQMKVDGIMNITIYQPKVMMSFVQFASRRGEGGFVYN